MKNPERLATLDTQDTGWRQTNKETLEKTEGAIKNGQSRETDSIGHTRHRTKKKNTHTQHNIEN